MATGQTVSKEIDYDVDHIGDSVSDSEFFESEQQADSQGFTAALKSYMSKIQGLLQRLTRHEQKIKRLEAQLDELRDKYDKQLDSRLPDKQFYSVPEVAEMVNRCQRTIRRWIKDGKLTSKKSSDADRGQHMIPRSSVQKLLDTHEKSL